MNKEAAPIVAKMTSLDEKVISGRKVYKGRLFGEKTAVLVSGVGKVNAACGAQIAIDKLKAEVIINIGVAGGLNGKMKVGEIYSISEVVQYDFDLTQLNGTKIGTLDECEENFLPLKAPSCYPLKKLATADRFNDDKNDFKLITKVLGTEIRDMECGGIAQACMHAGIPLYSFKIISDLAGSGSTTEQYLENLSLCFKTLNRELDNIVKVTG